MLIDSLKQWLITRKTRDDRGLWPLNWEWRRMKAFLRAHITDLMNWLDLFCSSHALFWFWSECIYTFPPVIGKGLFSVGGKKSTHGCLEDHLLGRLCLLGLWWKKKKQHKGRRVYLILSVRSHHPPYWKDLAAETIVNSLHHVIGWEALHDQCCDLACFLLWIQNRTAAYGMVPPTLSMCLSISPSQLTQSTNSHMGKCPESCLLDGSRSCRVDNQY